MVGGGVGWGRGRGSSADSDNSKHGLLPILRVEKEEKKLSGCIHVQFRHNCDERQTDRQTDKSKDRIHFIACLLT